METKLKNLAQYPFAVAALDAHKAMARIARVRLVAGLLTAEEFRTIRRRQDQALSCRLHTIITKIGEAK